MCPTPDAGQPPTERPAPTTTSTPTPTGTVQTGGTDEAVVEVTSELNFVPGALTIPAGTTIVWRNVGSVSHSATAYGDGTPDAADYFASGGFETEADASEVNSLSAVPPPGADRCEQRSPGDDERPGSHWMTNDQAPAHRWL